MVSTNNGLKTNMRVYRLLSMIATCVWGSIGSLIIISIYNDRSLLYINVIMGLVFYAITYYLYVKSKNTLSLISMIKDQNNQRVRNQFLNLELFFFSMSTLIGLVILSGAISRVFYENFAVFG